MLYAGHKIAVVIPALNEGKTIEEVVRSAKIYSDIVIVVDDGSSYDTQRMAEQGGAVVIRNKKNLGYELSIEEGFKRAAELCATVLVTIDADGQHNSRDIARLSEPIVRGMADVSIGERKEYRKKISESLVALYTKNRFQIRDPLCGLKAYSRKVYESVGHFDTGKLIGTQLAIEATKIGFKVINVPIEIIPRQDRSRFYAKSMQANLKVLKSFFRILFL